MENEGDKNRSDRRTFLGYVIGAIAGFLTAAIGIPVAGAAILPTLRQRDLSWAPAGPVSDFPVGQPKSAPLSLTIKDGWVERTESRGVWVIRRGDNDFTVFNGRCVHLGCAYNWVADQQRFTCPCHGGVYTADGTVVGGPPPRPLDTLDWRIEGGNLVVGYTDFRLGVPEKVTI